MALPTQNRTTVIVIAGAAAAIVLAVGAAFMFGAGRENSVEAPPASRGGLTVALSDAPGLEPTRQLRCFVDGRFVGQATLSECAARNGLATDALDVGLDASGNLAAAPTAAFAPPPTLPQTEELALMPEPRPNTPVRPEPVPEARPVATGSVCLRYTGSEWRSVAGDMSLNQCVQTLYSGICVRPGDALYGRWGDTTLRLVPRRVEQSPDNSRFRVLTEQDRDCRIRGV